MIKGQHLERLTPQAGTADDDDELDAPRTATMLDNMNAMHDWTLILNASASVTNAPKMTLDQPQEE